MNFDLDPVTRRPWEFKWQRILAAFLDGQSWHTIDAVQRLHTTCLHSDISGLKERGLKFNHDRITVAGYGASKAPVVRYSLLPESYALARRLLGIATTQSTSNDAKAYLLASTGARG